MKKLGIILTALLCAALAFAFAACGENQDKPDTPTRIYIGTLKGTVTENDSALAGVTVTSGAEKTVTDSDGNYSIKVYDDGLLLIFEKQGHITQKKTFKNSSFYSEEVRYDFTMFISTKVEGIVKDGNGAAVEGAIVSVGLQSVTTGADGKFLFESVIGTSMVLTVEHGGKTLRKPLYTEEMRTGAVNTEIIMG